MSVVLLGRFVRLRQLVLACACSAACVACFDEPRVVLDAATGGEQDGGQDDAAIGDRGACIGAIDGLACGDGRHCIDGVCAFNRCGDGVVAGAEQCDDGNLNLGDACTPSCGWAPAICGDGRVYGAEQCDDGNRDDLDNCSNLCLLNPTHDASVLGPPSAECPSVSDVVVTAYDGEDERLHGRYFTVKATLSREPDYLEWLGDPLFPVDRVLGYAGGGGQMFPRSRTEFGFHCSGAALIPLTLSLFVAHRNCVAVTHHFEVPCAPLNSGAR